MALKRPTCGLGISFGAAVLLHAGSGALAGPYTTSGMRAQYGSSATYNQRGVVVSVNGWPTVYTNNPVPGVYYGWTYPYYHSTYRQFPDGWPSLSLGYPYWPRYGPGTPFYWNDAPWFWPRTYDGPPLVEVARRVDPALLNLPAVPAPPPPAPPTLSQMARSALDARDYERAALIYARLADEQRQLESSSAQPQPVDRNPDRLQALALAGARQFGVAAEIIASVHAHDADPTTLRASESITSAAELRRIVNDAVAWAHKEGSPQAWRLVAFLMDVEGRAGPAERMRERADLLERPAPPQPAPTLSTPPSHGPAQFSMPAPTAPPDAAPEQPDR